MQTQFKMDNELYHYGILGQKWGIRRYQNKDGSLTAAGRKRANRLADEYEKTTGKKISYHGNSSSSSGSKKKISEMSDDEIRVKINRLKMEQELKNLSPKDISLGQRMISALKDSAVSTVKDKASKVIGDAMEKKLKKQLGLDEKDPVAELKKQAESAMWKKKIAESEAYINSQKVRTTPTKNLIGDISDLTDQQVKDMINRINDENNLIRKLAERG